MSHKAVISKHGPGDATLKSYVIGFVLSVGLTLLAYGLVVGNTYSRHVLLGVIAVLAVIQFVVQMVFFLHLGRETKPRWKLTVFWFMLMVVLILVFGSLWIMSNLDYHHDHMTPDQTDNAIIKDEGVQQ